MLRGIFMPGASRRTRSTTTSTSSRRCARLPEWKKYSEDAAFNTTFMTGKQYADWVQNAENVHKGLMQEAGFLAAK